MDRIGSSLFSRNLKRTTLYNTYRLRIAGPGRRSPRRGGEGPEPCAERGQRAAPGIGLLHVVRQHRVTVGWRRAAPRLLAQLRVVEVRGGGVPAAWVARGDALAHRRAARKEQVIRTCIGTFTSKGNKYITNKYTKNNGIQTNTTELVFQ